MKRAILCFTRVPIPGRTKTRLLPVLTPDQCAGLHTAFLWDLADLFRQAAADLFVFYTPDPGWEALRAIFPGAALLPQEGPDLGARMEGALRRVLALGYDRCILTGSDLPLVRPEMLEAAFAALEGADVTLGPTEDGGYWLVGCKAPCPALFEGQEYGGATVWDNALAAAKAAGYRLAPAPGTMDVDDPEDLKRLRAALRGQQTATARFLEELPC